MAKPKIVFDFEANSVRLVSELEKSRKALQGMKTDLSLIKFDSIVNLGEKAFRYTKIFYDFGKSIASAANDIQRNAKTLNMSTDEYQKWIYVAKMADLQTEDLMNGIKFLTKSMSETLQGTGDAAKAFERLGVNVKDSTGKTKDQQTVMFETIGALGKFADGVNRDSLMLAIFGRSWMTLKPLIDAGTGAITDWMNEAVKMGTVIGDVILEKGSQAETQFKKLEAQINATKISFAPMALEFAKAMNSMLDGLKQFFGYVEDQSTKDYWGKGWIGKAFGLKGPVGEGLGATPSTELPGFAVSHGALKGGKPEAPSMGLGLSEAELRQAKIGREERDEWFKELVEQWNLETKELDESARNWGEYADSVIGDLEKLNQQGIALREEQLKREEYANQKILEGQEEFNKEWIEAWDAVNQMYVDKAKEKIDYTGEFMKQFSSGLSSAWSTNLTGMLKGTTKFSDGIKNIFTGMADSVISSLTKILANLALFGNMKGEYKEGEGLLGGAGGLIKSGIGLIGGLLSPSAPVADWATPIGTAEGGIFDKPQLRLIGEEGPEAVIPLDRLERSNQKDDRPPSITNINIMTLDTATMEQWVRKNSKMFVDVAVDNIRRGGQLKTAVRGA